MVGKRASNSADTGDKKRKPLTVEGTAAKACKDNFEGRMPDEDIYVKKVNGLTILELLIQDLKRKAVDKTMAIGKKWYGRCTNPLCIL